MLGTPFIETLACRTRSTTMRNNLAEIRKLDPQRDHQRIAFLTMRAEFPFDTTRALEFALFRTFAVPSIGGLLDQTQEFERNSQKRYDDTDILVSEIIEHGYDSERGKRAIRRMNQLHGRFPISNEDFLYVLSTFVFEPIRFIDRFGWRKLIDKERLALFSFWREVGRRMGMMALPTDYASFERFNIEYERQNFCFTEANQRVGRATVELFASWFPWILRPIVRRAIYALLDDSLSAAFGFPRPSRAMRLAVTAVLKVRALVLRLLPRSGEPVLRTLMKRPSYPAGYVIEHIGPETATTASR